MKGAATRTHIYVINTCFATKFAVTDFTQTPFLDLQPRVPIPVTNCFTHDPITFTVNADPPTAVAFAGSQSTPTATALFAISDDRGNSLPFQNDYFVLPKCTSCLTSGTSIFDVMRSRQSSIQVLPSSALGSAKLSARPPAPSSP